MATRTKRHQSLSPHPHDTEHRPKPVPYHIKIPVPLPPTFTNLTWHYIHKAISSEHARRMFLFVALYQSLLPYHAYLFQRIINNLCHDLSTLSWWDNWNWNCTTIKVYRFFPYYLIDLKLKESSPLLLKTLTSVTYIASQATSARGAVLALSLEREDVVRDLKREKKERMHSSRALALFYDHPSSVARRRWVVEICRRRRPKRKQHQQLPTGCTISTIRYHSWRGSLPTLQLQ